MIVARPGTVPGGVPKFSAQAPSTPIPLGTFLPPVTGAVGSGVTDTNTVLLVHGDGTAGSTTFIDSSSYAHTLTPTSTTVTATNKFGGGAADFTASGSSVINTGDANGFHFGAGPFTIEAWCYFTSAPADLPATPTIACQWAGPSNTSWFFGFVSGSLDFYYSADGSSASDSPYPYSPPLATWVHLAVDRDTRNVLRTYVNGTALTATTVTTAFYLTPQTCTIGNRLDIGASNFPGYLDEVRISNVARYGGSFTPPAVPFLSLNTDTSLLVHADGANGSTAFIDSSIYAHTLTASGSAQVTTSSPKFGTGSVTFSSGVGSVSAGASVDLEFASLPFTVEAWAYFTAAPDSSYRAIISKYSDVGTSHLESWWFGIDNSSKLAFLWSLDGTYNVSLNLLGAISPTLNTWYHLAADRDAAGTLRIYLNGAVLNSASVTESFFPSSAACLIGDDGTPTSVSFPGNLDEIRVTKGLARYGGAFTPPAQAFLPEYTVGLTQAAQTLSATGNVSTGTAITGTLNVTQTGQTLAATGTVTVGGTLSVTQAAQTLAATGGITVGGTLGVTQAAQTLAATGWSAAFGPIAATQAPHTLVALGVDVLGGTLVVTQAPQTLAAAGSPRVGGTLGITQAPQTLAALGGPVVGGTLGVTQATQTLAAAGWRAATGTLAVTQAPQTLAGLGSVVTGTSGSLLLTQAPQTLSASATLGGVTGALGITQAPQILAGIGVVTPTISGTLNLTQEEQILVATAVVFTPSAVTTQARVLVMA